jgi:hypothetical protein
MTKVFEAYQHHIHTHNDTTKWHEECVFCNPPDGPWGLIEMIELIDSRGKRVTIHAPKEGGGGTWLG